MDRELRMHPGVILTAGLRFVSTFLSVKVISEASDTTIYSESVKFLIDSEAGEACLARLSHLPMP
jgi:hypothetical protein